MKFCIALKGDAVDLILRISPCVALYYRISKQCNALQQLVQYKQVVKAKRKTGREEKGSKPACLSLPLMGLPLPSESFQASVA